MFRSPLIITSDNYEPESGDFVVPFNVNQTFKQTQIAISNLSLYNCIPNVSSDLNNRSFSVFWPEGASGHLEYTYTLTDESLYSLTSFSSWLKEQMEEDYLFLVASGDVNETPIHQWFMGTNSSYQNICAFTAITPTSVQPTGASWQLPTSNRTLYFDFKNLALSKIFGYSNPVVGETSGTITNSVKSDIVPQPFDTQSIIIRCNLVKSEHGICRPSDILGSINIPTAKRYGSLITKLYPKNVWKDVSESQFNELRISMYSQHMKKLKLIDPNITLLLLLKK